MFKNAIVRKPGKNFSQGLTTSNLGVPDYKKTIEQHNAYCRALEQCGLNLTYLDADLDYPDSTFVEDTFVLTHNAAILTNPGADSRKGEVALIQPILTRFYKRFYNITSPGTLEGGDICEAGSHFFIGISHRTNEEGARQLSGFLEKEGYSSSTVDIRDIPGILHLKSGVAWLQDRTLVIIDDLKDHPAFMGWKVIQIDPEEAYAANCVRVNNQYLLANGFPNFQTRLENLGLKVIPLNVSEFQKMDGGLSCLSLRF